MNVYENEEIRVLLVDDEQSLLEQAKLFLEKEDDRLNIVTKTSAKEGLESLEENEFDAIVSDFQMPEINGLEFLEEVRSKENSIPFIIFTGKGREEVAMEALNLGANRYLQKGRDPKSQYGVLADAIEQEVRHARTDAEWKSELREKKRLMNAVPDIIFRLNEEGNLVDWNEEALRASSYSVEDLEGKHALEFFPEDEREKISNGIEEAFQRGHAEREGSLLTGDGGRIPYSLSVTTLEDENGNVTGLIGVGRDISKRKEMEEVLRKSEEKYRILVETTGLGYHILDKNGNVLDANMEYVHQTGHESFSDIEGRNVLEWTAEHDVERNRKALERCVGEGEVRELVVDYAQKDGGVKSIEINAAVVETEEQKKILAICKDVTNQIKKKRKLEEAYKTLEASRDTFLIADETGEILYCNEAVEENFGYSKDELIGKSVTVLMPEEYKSRHKQAVMKRLEEGGMPQHPLEVEGLRKDGFRFPIEWSLSIYEDEDGPKRMIGVMRDITERKKAEQKVKFESNLLNSLMETVPDFIFFKDKEGRFVRVNNAYAALLDAEPEEVAGKTDFDFYPDEQAERFIENDMQVINDEKPIIGKEETLKSNGEDQVISTTKVPWYNEDGDLIGLLGISRDISERKRMEEKLRESEKRYERTIENAGIGLVLYGTGGEIKIFNPKIEEITGYNKEELGTLDDWFKKLYPDKKRREKIREKWFNIIENKGEVTRGEAEIKTKSGETRILLFDGVRLESGEVLSFARDITERRRVKQREEFLHSLLRHDLGNKIQIMQSSLELLKDLELTEEQKQFIEMGVKAGREGFNLIEKIKTLKEVGEEKVKNIKLNPIINSVISENEPKAEENGLNIEYEKAECTVRGGPLLRELFVNLLENSIKHSEGSKIRITSQTTENYCIISIEDDGIGIPDEEKKKIFEKDYKKGSEAGSGLGLRMVKRIAESYGGGVEVKDSDLGGVKMVVRLEKA